MTPMNKRRLLLSISWVLIAGSCLVIIGWLFGIESLVKVHPDLASTKFISALLFLLCGVQLHSVVKIFIDKKEKHFVAFIVFTAITICIILLCITVVLQPNTGYILDFLPKEETYDVWTRIPYLPSLVTLCIFFITAFTRLLLICSRDKITNLLPFIGIAISLAGLVAIIGNILAIPSLVYATSYSGGMGIVTAAFFVITGIFYIILGSLLRKTVIHHP